jgi:hypothetical protein
MPWLLTKKKKKSTGGKSAKRGSSASPKPWDPQRTLLVLRVLGGLTVGLGLILGWRFGEQALVRYAQRTKAYTVSPDNVILADAPRWMSQAVRMELQSHVAQAVSDKPMDSKSLRQAAGALHRDPWVRQVHQVQRMAQGSVCVRAEYREPVAVVEGRDGYHLIDRAGVCLPGLYFRHQVDRLGLPLITGVASAPPRTAGERWDGAEIDAAVALIHLLRYEPYFGQIKAFDVAERDARGRVRLTLHTARGMVVWGLPPGEEKAVEPDAMIKRQRLRDVARVKSGLIDAGGQVVHVHSEAVQTVQSSVGVEQATWVP